MKTYAVLFQRRQEGWTCEITFTCTTGRQFTDETMTVSSAVYRSWFAAWRNARLSAKVWAAANRAVQGERAEKGWTE
jgi:hypothetical protein